MQLRYRISIYVFLFWIGMVHPTDASEPEVKVQHELVTSSDLADGSFLATYRFTFTNPGSSDISMINVRFVTSAGIFIAPEPVEFAVGTIAAGQSISQVREIYSYTPDVTFSMFVGNGEGIGASGDVVNFGAVSVRGGVQ